VYTNEHLHVLHILLHTVLHTVYTAQVEAAAPVGARTKHDAVTASATSDDAAAATDDAVSDTQHE
jgi:hypothetical protein